MDVTAEELERVLIQKEGESLRDTGVQGRSPGGGKRVIGKAVAKGGLLLKGKNPGNVCHCFTTFLHEADLRLRRSNDKKMTSGLACRQHLTHIAKI